MFKFKIKSQIPFECYNLHNFQQLSRKALSMINGEGRLQTGYRIPDARKKPGDKSKNLVSSNQYPVSSIEHPLSSIQHRASSIQYPGRLHLSQRADPPPARPICRLEGGNVLGMALSLEPVKLMSSKSF
jgi:hypothetical protein